MANNASSESSAHMNTLEKTTDPNATVCAQRSDVINAELQLKRDFNDFDITANNQNPLAHKEAPLADKEAPQTNKEASQANKEAPLTNIEVPLANKEAPQTKKEAPLTNTEVPLANKEAPQTIKEAPLTNKEAPQANEEAPLTNTEVPLANKEATRFQADEKCDFKMKKTEPYKMKAYFATNYLDNMTKKIIYYPKNLSGLIESDDVMGVSQKIPISNPSHLANKVAPGFQADTTIETNDVCKIISKYCEDNNLDGIEKRKIVYPKSLSHLTAGKRKVSQKVPIRNASNFACKEARRSYVSNWSYTTKETNNVLKTIKECSEDNYVDASDKRITYNQERKAMFGKVSNGQKKLPSIQEMDENDLVKIADSDTNIENDDKLLKILEEKGINTTLQDNSVSSSIGYPDVEDLEATFKHNFNDEINIENILETYTADLLDDGQVQLGQIEIDRDLLRTGCCDEINEKILDGNKVMSIYQNDDELLGQFQQESVHVLKTYSNKNKMTKSKTVLLDGMETCIGRSKNSYHFISPEIKNMPHVDNGYLNYALEDNDIDDLVQTRKPHLRPPPGYQEIEYKDANNTFTIPAQSWPGKSSTVWTFDSENSQKAPTKFNDSPKREVMFKKKINKRQAERNEIILKSDELPGYRGNQSMNEVLNFIESSSDSTTRNLTTSQNIVSKVRRERGFKKDRKTLMKIIDQTEYRAELQTEILDSSKKGIAETKNFVENIGTNSKLMETPKNKIPTNMVLNMPKHKQLKIMKTSKTIENLYEKPKINLKKPISESKLETTTSKTIKENNMEGEILQSPGTAVAAKGSEPAHEIPASIVTIHFKNEKRHIAKRNLIKTKAANVTTKQSNTIEDKTAAVFSNKNKNSSNNQEIEHDFHVNHSQVSEPEIIVTNSGHLKPRPVELTLNTEIVDSKRNPTLSIKIMENYGNNLQDLEENIVGNTKKFQTPQKSRIILNSERHIKKNNRLTFGNTCQMPTVDGNVKECRKSKPKIRTMRDLKIKKNMSASSDGKYGISSAMKPLGLSKELDLKDHSSDNRNNVEEPSKLGFQDPLSDKGKKAEQAYKAISNIKDEAKNKINVCRLLKRGSEGQKLLDTSKAEDILANTQTKQKPRARFKHNQNTGVEIIECNLLSETKLVSLANETNGSRTSSLLSDLLTTTQLSAQQSPSSETTSSETFSSVNENIHSHRKDNQKTASLASLTNNPEKLPKDTDSSSTSQTNKSCPTEDNQLANNVENYAGITINRVQLSSLHKRKPHQSVPVENTKSETDIKNSCWMTPSFQEKPQQNQVLFEAVSSFESTKEFVEDKDLKHSATCQEELTAKTQAFSSTIIPPCTSDLLQVVRITDLSTLGGEHTVSIPDETAVNLPQVEMNNTAANINEHQTSIPSVARTNDGYSPNDMVFKEVILPSTGKEDNAVPQSKDYNIGTQQQNQTTFENENQYHCYCTCTSKSDQRGRRSKNYSKSSNQRLRYHPYRDSRQFGAMSDIPLQVEPPHLTPDYLDKPELSVPARFHYPTIIEYVQVENIDGLVPVIPRGTPIHCTDTKTNKFCYYALNSNNRQTPHVCFLHPFKEVIPIFHQSPSPGGTVPTIPTVSAVPTRYYPYGPHNSRVYRGTTYFTQDYIALPYPLYRMNTPPNANHDRASPATEQTEHKESEKEGCN